MTGSDIWNYLVCRYKTSMDIKDAINTKSPTEYLSSETEVHKEHENQVRQKCVSQLESMGLKVVNINTIVDDHQAVLETIEAMHSGVDVILEAGLKNERWYGRPYIMMKVDRSSSLGDWSYEVYDCIELFQTKAETIIQLLLYSELVESIQDLLPESIYIISKREMRFVEKYRVLDYYSYYKYVKRKCEKFIENKHVHKNVYPEPTQYCEICRWNRHCDKRRRDDDHLSLVAGITRLQRKQLHLWNRSTVQRLSHLPLPIKVAPNYDSKMSYIQLREQARIQVESRNAGKPIFEIIESNENTGLCQLPKPSLRDVFLDIKGAPNFGRTGLDYLFGFAYVVKGKKTKFDYRWALSYREEKEAFVWIIESIMQNWVDSPHLHVYHFSNYVPITLKKLMGIYGLCEDDVDRMLRAGLFVDLQAITRQSMYASVEQYSLKALEEFHCFERSMSLDISKFAIRKAQHCIETGRTADIDDSIKKIIQQNHEDNCRSLNSLRDWLEKIRSMQNKLGTKMKRPIFSDGSPSEALIDRQAFVASITEELKSDLPDDTESLDESQEARRLLANLIDWHRREDKADWWELFRLGDLSDRDLIDERSALSGLKPLEQLDSIVGSCVHMYMFEEQESDIRTGQFLRHGKMRVGEVYHIDYINRFIDIKKTRNAFDFHPSSVFVDPSGPDSEVLAGALFRLAFWVSINGIDAPGSHRAARDLLLRRSPRLKKRAKFKVLPGESTDDAAIRIAVNLNDSILAIQGPPGSGKTYTGARIICELVRNRKKVGVTAISHKVIRNLLDEVVSVSRALGIVDLKCLQKVWKKPDEGSDGIIFTRRNKDILDSLNSDIDVVAGTAWLWSREEFFESLDVLVVDEAGQMSLANVLAISQAAKNLVLLGDPQQLEQPIKGSHPEGADSSAMEYLLNGARTIPTNKGLFLESTRRLHPNICRYTSEIFYDNRLQSLEGLDRQRISGHPKLSGAGLWFVPVHHEGNQNSSIEEVEYVAKIMESFMSPRVKWIDHLNQKRILSIDDVLIVAPYNAQVAALSARLPGARVGTVDKFQGQQAPIVIYSLSSSSPEDAPHGMKFLYSMNRLNVATSRAQAIVILVGNPLLLEPECRSPNQMKLANALCRFLELAKIYEID